MNILVSDYPARQEHPAEPVAAAGPVLSTADTAECTCPDFCERDHETD